MYYYGARYYDPRISIFVSVDPLAEETMTPYQYVYNNPIMFTDPTGMAGESIGVREVGEGKYEVVNGNHDDGDRGIYLVDSEGNYDKDKSKKIANSITTHSFFDEKENVVKGAIIDMKSKEGSDFINKVIDEDPSLPLYMFEATNFGDYDFKAEGWDKNSTDKAAMLKHYYRGSLDSNGEVGSARDYGNIGAGLVAARSGISWNTARYGFDTYQGYKSNGFTIVPTPGMHRGTTGLPVPTVIPVREAKTSVMAQMVGFLRGTQKFRR